MPGVFISALLFCLAASAVNADCTPTRALQPVRLERIVDGDTVQLRGGERVRLIGLNAPELGRNGKASEPLAAQAKQALTELLPRDRDIYLEAGAEARDRHGRRLAHLFLRRNGGSVEAEQLRRGLGFHVVVPPNNAHTNCLALAERDARRLRIGVWNTPYFSPRDSRSLDRGDAGFRRVRLQVETVTGSRDGWWLEGGQLAVRLSKQALPADAEHCAPTCWRGHSLTLRGWVVDRSSDRTVRERGYPPLLLRIDHPAMIESAAASVSAPTR